MNYIQIVRFLYIIFRVTLIFNFFVSIIGCHIFHTLLFSLCSVNAAMRLEPCLVR